MQTTRHCFYFTPSYHIVIFIRLRDRARPTPALKQSIISHMRESVGPIATPDQVFFTSKLPKTRSGKIMRRVLKAVILDRDPGDITTIEDEGSVDDARRAWEQMRADIKAI